MRADKYPSDHAMIVLGGVWLGSTVAVRGGRVYLKIDGPRSAETVPAPDPVIDELESRGWLEAVSDEDGMLRATERGSYHARVWLEKRLGK